MLKTITGKIMDMKTVEKEEMSVLTPGYIITPEGNIIEINDDKNHSEIFNEYLNKFCENSKNKEIKLDCFETMGILMDYKNVLYFGVRINSKSMLSGNSEGIGMIMIPSSEETTLEQNEVIKTLEKKNISIFGNRNIVELEVYDFETKKQISIRNIKNNTTNNRSKK